MRLEIAAPSPETAAEIVRRLTGAQPVQIQEIGPAELAHIRETFACINTRRHTRRTPPWASSKP